MKTKKQVAGKAFLGMLSVVLVLAFGLLLDGFSVVSLAASQGKITATSVNVRAEASAGSAVVAGAVQNDVVTVNGQVTGSDGKVWYKVEVNGVTGYIRSDLMNVTEDSVPDTTDVPTAEVTAVEPVSAKVTGGQQIRVRGDASTSSRIVTTVESGKELTIKGQATGDDNKTWYQVEFSKDGSTVTGFIREDFVNPSGTITPVTETQEPEQPEVQEPEQPEVQDPVVEERKRWETVLHEGKWYITDSENDQSYVVDDLIQGAAKNAELYYDSQKTVKSQKAGIVILVILLLAALAAVAYLVYKLKDRNDAAYISAVERETLNRRSAQQSNQRITHNVGPERETNKPAARPAGQSGQRPAQRSNGQPGQRPSGQPTQRTSGQPTQRPGGQPAQRPNGQSGQRPVGQPAQRPNGQPAQRPNGQPGQRPSGQPAQRPVGQPAQRPQNEEKNQYLSPEQEAQLAAERELARQRAQEVAALQEEVAQVAQADNSWKSKNFMSEEDEFEFDFLNWDGSEEQ